MVSVPTTRSGGNPSPTLPRRSNYPVSTTPHCRNPTSHVPSRGPLRSRLLPPIRPDRPKRLRESWLTTSPDNQAGRFRLSRATPPNCPVVPAATCVHFRGSTLESRVRNSLVDGRPVQLATPDFREPCRKPVLRARHVKCERRHDSHGLFRTGIKRKSRSKNGRTIHVQKNPTMTEPIGHAMGTLARRRQCGR